MIKGLVVYCKGNEFRAENKKLDGKIYT